MSEHVKYVGGYLHTYNGVANKQGQIQYMNGSLFDSEILLNNSKYFINKKL